MSFVANIIELDSDGKVERRHGKFEFLAMPSPGDNVKLFGPGDMSRELFRVLFVEHDPMEFPREEGSEDEQPWAVVFVEFVDREPI